MTLANITKMDADGYRLHETISIVSGQSISDVSEGAAQGYLLATIGIPSGFTGATIGVRGSSQKSPTPLDPMGYEDGTEVLLTVTPGSRIAVVPTTYQGIPYLQLSSGPSGGLVNQTSTVVFDLVFVRA